MLGIEHIDMKCEPWSKASGRKWRTSCRRSSRRIDHGNRWRMSALLPKADKEQTCWYVRFVPILLQKSFSSGDQKFSGL
jgi:hypothetical protein